MKATELRVGCVSFMYDPLVTATMELSAMDSANQEMSPLILRLSHSQVSPQLSMALQRSVRGAMEGALAHDETTLYTARASFLTEHISPVLSAGTSILERVQQFRRRVNRGTAEGV